MEDANARDIVIEKVLQLPTEEVSKLLIFLAGIEAGREANKKANESKSA